MNIIFLTSETTHHYYLINEIHKYCPVKKVFFQAVDKKERTLKDIIKKIKKPKDLEYLLRSLLINIFLAKERKLEEKYERKIFFKNKTPSLDHSIPSTKLISFNNSESVTKIKKEKPDLIIVFGTDILKGEILEIANIDIINIHRDILPNYRGSGHPYWAFLNKDFKNLGCTIHKCIKEVDAGDIVGQKYYKLQSDDKIYKLQYKTTILALNLLREVINKYKNKTTIYKKQKKTKLWTFRSLTIIKLLQAKKNFNEYIKVLQKPPSINKKKSIYFTKFLQKIIDKLGINFMLRFLNKNKAIILWYHGVCDDNFQLLTGYDERHVPKSIFREQIRYLKRKGYVFSTISELIDIITKKKEIKKLVVLTFDDGFRNIIENAYPIMRELNAKGCFYLVSNLIGSNNLLWTDHVETIVRNSQKGDFKFIFKGEKINYSLDNKESYENTMSDIKNRLRSISNKERIEHLKQFKGKKIVDKPKEFLFSNWKQIQELDRRILEVGSHSKTHPNLTNLNSNEEFIEEIKNSKVQIEKMVNYKIVHFNYPAGVYNDEVIERVKKYGYKSAVSTIHGFNDENTDLYHLKRIESTSDFLLFKSSISGSYLVMRRIKNLFCRKNKSLNKPFKQT